MDEFEGRPAMKWTRRNDPRYPVLDDYAIFDTTERRRFTIEIPAASVIARDVVWGPDRELRHLAVLTMEGTAPAWSVPVEWITEIEDDRPEVQ